MVHRYEMWGNVGKKKRVEPRRERKPGERREGNGTMLSASFAAASSSSRSPQQRLMLPASLPDPLVHESGCQSSDLFAKHRTQPVIWYVRRRNARLPLSSTRVRMCVTLSFSLFLSRCIFLSFSRSRVRYSDTRGTGRLFRLRGCCDERSSNEALVVWLGVLM